MKLTAKKIILSAVAVFIIVGAFILINIPPKEEKTVEYSANWVEQQETFSEALNNATQVVYAKVKNHNSYRRDELVFTDTEIEILDVLKGGMQKGDTCTLHFTGGTLDGILYKVEGLSIPDKNETYLFALREYNTANGPLSGHYLPIGGYQRIFKAETNAFQSIGLNSVDKIKVVPFNPDNNLEAESTGKTLEEIRAMVISIK